MAEFNPICESIIVKFTCPNCGAEVSSDYLHVPTPDFTAESSSESTQTDYYDIICESCGHEFEVTINNAMYCGDVDVEGVENVAVDEQYTEDEYEEYVFDLTSEKISSVLNDIEHLPQSTKELLYRELFVGAITSMEAFLSTTLKREVLSSSEIKRKFIESYKPYQKVNLRFSDIYNKLDSIDSVIQESLRSLMYHDLHKIKPIYKDVLNIDLGDIGEIMKAVRIRHDIVHRAGMDKDGILRNITKEDILKLVEDVSTIISKVDCGIAQTGEPQIAEYLNI